MKTLIVLVSSSALACGAARPVVIPDTREPLELAEDLKATVVVPVKEGEKVTRWRVPFEFRAGDYCAIRSSALGPAPAPVAPTTSGPRP